MTDGQQVLPESNRYGSSVGRSIAIVEFLAGHPRETFSLSEIARRCGIPKPTAHKILGALHASGWVSRSPLNLRYGLGPTLILIGHAASEVRPEVNLARPVMEELATQFRCECMLSTAVSDEILILESTGPVVRVGSTFRTGAQTPLVAPFGACFIAWRSPDEWHEWYARSGLGDAQLREQMDAILHVTVERGYVVTLHTDFQDQVAEAVRLMPKDLTAQQIRAFLTQRLASLSQVAYLGGGIAGRQGACMVESLQAPVFDVDGMPRYDLALVIHREFEPEALDRIGRRLRAAADGVSAAIERSAGRRGHSNERIRATSPGTSPPLSS
ncbi:MAG: IclR family transcriptional regulator [Acidimicrobiales bacterium]